MPEKIFIEGRRLVEEVLRSDVAIEECFFSVNFDDLECRKAFHGRTSELPAKLLDSIADTKQPQGVARHRTASAGKAAGYRRLCGRPSPVIIFLYEVNNPSNLRCRPPAPAKPPGSLQGGYFKTFCRRFFVKGSSGCHGFDLPSADLDR